MVVFTVVALAHSCACGAGEKSTINVRLSDPGRPCYVECHLINGGISVEAYDGREVVVESRYRMGDDDDWFDWDDDEDEDKPARSKQGLKKLTVSSSALEVEEDDNRVTISAGSWARAVDISMKVPVRTSLDLKCINSGDIVVVGVTGEVEAENINGSVTLRDISGSAVAYVQNGDMTAELKTVTRDTPMSFASFNGDVDVTLPASVRATVKVSTHTGDAYSDFDIQVVDRPAEVIEENNEHGEGKYRVRIEDAFYGNINGGGPEFDFSTFNGDIFIRKAK
jgi:DUF4097 and DUF4098 domain-containing protein YvlB